MRGSDPKSSLFETSFDSVSAETETQSVAFAYHSVAFACHTGALVHHSEAFSCHSERSEESPQLNSATNLALVLVPRSSGAEPDSSLRSNDRRRSLSARQPAGLLDCHETDSPPPQEEGAGGGGCGPINRPRPLLIKEGSHFHAAWPVGGRGIVRSSLRGKPNHSRESGNPPRWVPASAGTTTFATFKSMDEPRMHGRPERQVRKKTQKSWERS